MTDHPPRVVTIRRIQLDQPATVRSGPARLIPVRVPAELEQPAREG